MAYTYSQLYSIRKQAQDAKSELTALWCTLLSFDLASQEDLVEEPLHHPFESPSVRIEDTGDLCDDIVLYCNEQIKLLDNRKEKEAAGSIAPRNSRWY